MMHLIQLILLLVPGALCTALTFSLPPNGEQCFHVFNTELNTNIGFVFAVQSGGSFDVNYRITEPDNKVIVSELKQAQGDYVFNANVIGEYAICFDNDMSTFAEKVISFEIKMEEKDSSANYKASLPDAPRPNDAVEGIQSSVESVETKLNDLTNTLHYYKTRINRNQSTVKSTEGRIVWFSFFDLLLMLGMALFQIAVVKFFFQGSRKQLV